MSKVVCVYLFILNFVIIALLFYKKKLTAYFLVKYCLLICRCFVLTVLYCYYVMLLIYFSGREQISLQVDASDVDYQIMREHEEALHQLEVFNVVCK